MEHIGDQLRAFIAIIGASVAAWVGLWARHATDPQGFSWRRLFAETPVAVLCGIVAGALGAWAGFETLVVYGLASAAAYISPPVVFSILRKRIEKNNEDI